MGFFDKWSEKRVWPSGRTSYRIDYWSPGFFSKKQGYYWTVSPELPECSTVSGSGKLNLQRISYTFHCEDGPAVVYADGSKEWYQNGRLHRTDGPAQEHAFGRGWFVDDKLHRLDGPAYEYPDGKKEWYQNGNLHRLDGPAIEYPDGKKEWYQNNRLHRTDGPAIIYPNGFDEYYINGIQMIYSEWVEVASVKSAAAKRKRKR